ncbi:MAG: TIGR04283 family arsenosugar biosynthesis glycosyltransferase [Sporichthyaceae bacterium]
MLAVSIIVPVRNEAALVASSVSRLLRDFPECEVIVVDGASTDGTPELVPAPARVLRTEPGRARQQNAGAAAARGDVLWFVHVDVALDPAALEQLRAALADPAVHGGGLSLRFDAPSAGLHFLAWSSNVRARRLGHVFGDQAMFVRRETFAALGGFAPLPLMEDFEFSRRLHRRARLVVLTASSTASARRLQAHGVWRMIVFMQGLKLAYLAGVDTERIRRRYDAGPPWPLRRRTSGARAMATR